MGGGAHPPFTVSEWHTKGGVAVGFVMWMWIFYRAKLDLPVVLGLRHPWDHVENDEHHAAAHEDAHFAYLHETWDKHAADTLKVRNSNLGNWRSLIYLWWCCPRSFICDFIHVNHLFMLCRYEMKMMMMTTMKMRRRRRRNKWRTSRVIKGMALF